MASLEKLNFTVGEGDLKRRLDHFLKSRMEGYSRSQIQRWIFKGAVLCNGMRAEAAHLVLEGERIEVSVPPEEISLAAEPLHLDILYEDTHLLVINKPAGMVMHPAAGNYSGTLANALAYHLKNSKTNLPAGSFRIGLVHRLDRDTSGLLVVAKNTRVLENLSAQFKERTIKKVYRAIVAGRMKSKEGEIESPIGREQGSSRMAVLPFGKFSLTKYKTLKLFSSHSYLEAYPKTGRTHQIRVHLAKIGHAVLGDKIYGKEEAPRLMLHAYQLEFEHPVKKKRMKFTAPLPPDFQSVLRKTALEQVVSNGKFR